MIRIRNYYRWIITAAFFVVYYLYLIILNRHHLIYLEQLQLFRFDITYFLDFIERPGGLLEYTGAFFTQFFIFPFAGALLVTLAGLTVYVITTYIFHKHNVTGVLWALIPVSLLAALHSYHLYTLAYTIGLIVALGYLAVYISIEKNKWRYLFLLLGWPLLYIITGGYALLSTLLCCIHEVFFRKKLHRFLITSLFLIITISTPYLASLILFYIKEESTWTIFLPLFFGSPFKYIFICLLSYYPVVLIVAKACLTYSKSNMLSSGWNFKTVIAETVVLVLLWGVTVRFVYDRKTGILLGLDHFVQQANWDEVLKLSAASPYTNRTVMHFTNLALYKTGRMGDELFHYRQAGSEGLWLDWEQDWVKAFFGSEIYYQLAYISEAYRWAFEVMVVRGPNPRSLKRLAMTSLVNNDLELAEKYLRILDQTLFYKKWARHYLSYLINPERLEEDKEISEKRHFEIHSDFINSDNVGVRLPQLLADHPDNRMAFEYYMASLLLEKNLGDFAENIYRLKDLGYKSIPVHYEEALLAYMSLAQKNIVPVGYTISQSTLKRLSDYTGTIYSIGSNAKIAAREMYNKFGKTYWYYLEFINNQPQ